MGGTAPRAAVRQAARVTAGGWKERVDVWRFARRFAGDVTAQGSAVKWARAATAQLLARRAVGVSGDEFPTPR